MAQSGGGMSRSQQGQEGMHGMMDTALSALVLAWTTTMIAITLLLTALVASQVWDSAVYFRALESVWSAEV
jgi:hypothetical protein